MLKKLQKQNCWEFLKCGRESGGKEVAEMGLCPVSDQILADGLNGGINAGRICWNISGTFCGKKIQGSYARTQVSCKSCSFFKKVREEEGENFILEVNNG